MPIFITMGVPPLSGPLIGKKLWYWLMSINYIILPEVLKSIPLLETSTVTIPFAGIGSLGFELLMT